MTFLPLLGTVSESAEPLLALAAIAAFPIFWCLAVGSLAKLGGWQKLAEFYRIEKYPDGFIKEGGLQTVYLNKVRYKGALTIDYDEYGLYMRTLIFFRIGHPLLFIPWEDVTVYPRNEKGLFKFDFTRELTFALTPDVKVVFNKGLIERFEHFRDVKML